MKRALLILLVASTANAQPAWDPNTGWGADPMEQRVEQARARGQRVIEDSQRRLDEFERVREENRRGVEESSRKMDEDFDRSSRNAFLLFGSAVAAMFIAVAIAGTRRRKPALAIEPVHERIAAGAGGVDVSVLRVAIDPGAGKFIAQEIDRLTGQRGTQLLRELGLALRRVRVAWLYGGAVNEPMRSLGEAKAVFAKHVDEARLLADAATGGITLVTVVVCARGELMTVDHIDSEVLRRALEGAAYRDESEIIDVAVVVSHVGTAAELEARYPRPLLSPLVAVGMDKNFCSHCGGPFPKDLTRCPHCGAPATP